MLISEMLVSHGILEKAAQSLRKNYYKHDLLMKIVKNKVT